MSYDLTIAKDRSYSGSCPLGLAEEFLRSREHVEPNGERGFLFEPGPGRVMEIDLARVDSEGNILAEPGDDLAEINCIFLQIPYGGSDADLRRDHIPLALAIAGRLGWTVYDEQTGEAVPGADGYGDGDGDGDGDEPGPAERQQPGKPWWRFW